MAKNAKFLKLLIAIKTAPLIQITWDFGQWFSFSCIIRLFKNFSHSLFHSWPQFSRWGRVTISLFSTYWPEFYQNYIRNDNIFDWILFYVSFFNSVPNFRSTTSFLKELGMLQFSEITQKEGRTLTGSAIMKFWFF